MRRSSPQNVMAVGLLFAGSVMAVGCWDNSPVAKSTASGNDSSVVPEGASQDKENSTSKDATADPTAPTSSSADSATNKDSEKPPSQTEQPPETTNASGEPESAEPAVPPAPVDPIAAAGLEGYARERILLFTAAAPLVIEIIPVIDGESHTAALNQMVEEALKVADTDGDGRVKWEELAANRHFKYGQFGNVAVADERNKREFIRTYDINSDGYVDREEVPRLLTRNAGGAKPFSVRGGGFSPEQSESASFDLLDTDRSGELDESEIVAAAELLRGHDRNQDDFVSANELRPESAEPDMATNPSPMMVTRRRRGDAPDLVRLIYENAPWEVIQGNLENAYALGGRLDPETFPMFPEFFKAIDKDGDGKIKRGEMSGLVSLPPQIVFALRMGHDKPAPTTTEPPKAEPSDTPAAQPPQPASETTAEKPGDAAPAEPLPADPTPAEPPLADLAPATQPATTDAPKVERPTIQVLKIDPALMLDTALPPEAGRVRLALKTGLLDLYANDFVGNQSPAEQAKQTLATSDADKNGYLEANEIPQGSLLMRIEAVDENEDGKAYPDEIERFFYRRMGAQRGQIHARADYRDDPVLAWLDTNRDDRLDHLELQALPNRIKLLDKNSDGTIGRDELPDNLYFVLARGDLQNPAALFALPTARAGDNTGERPRWFTKMDVNRDGVINRREFLGELEQFKQLDTDGDSALSWAELRDLK